MYQQKKVYTDDICFKEAWQCRRINYLYPVSVVYITMLS